MSEFYKMLGVSTAHIKESTSDYLNNNEIPIPVYRKTSETEDCGWFVCVPESRADYEDVPEDLKDVINFARNKEVQWLMLDSDAAIYQELPVYDW